MIRVKMTTNGGSAVIDDFSNQGQAFKATKQIADGLGGKRVEQQGDLLRYESSIGYVHAFMLDATGEQSVVGVNP